MTYDEYQKADDVRFLQWVSNILIQIINSANVNYLEFHFYFLAIRVSHRHISGRKNGFKDCH